MTVTGARCPECERVTIIRYGGEWCRWCRGWVEAITIHHGEGEGSSLRVLRAQH